jgi:hypothetical protein
MAALTVFLKDMSLDCMEGGPFDGKICSAGRLSAYTVVLTLPPTTHPRWNLWNIYDTSNNSGHYWHHLVHHEFTLAVYTLQLLLKQHDKLTVTTFNTHQTMTTKRQRQQKNNKATSSPM